MLEHKPISLNVIQYARQIITKTAIRTPLIPLFLDYPPAEIYLKLENLQPVGSFKMRGAGTAILSADKQKLIHGVWTASAGNMAQAVAWYARYLQIPCMVIVPDDATSVIFDAIQRLNAQIQKAPFADYQAIQREHQCSGMEGLLIHPFGDDAVMAGNGTIGLEILEDLPDVDTIIVPYGGGGLSCGIASAIKNISPKVKVYGAEAATATPLASSLSAGKPVEVPYTASFISGIGAPFIFPEMWPLVSRLLDGSLVVELEQVVSTIRMMANNHHIIAEGAGCVALAAALNSTIRGKKIVCIVSGGNLDINILNKILIGEHV
jgi:threonine dehydratase